MIGPRIATEPPSSDCWLCAVAIILLVMWFVRKHGN
jgi:hypothetical protein